MPEVSHSACMLGLARLSVNNDPFSVSAEPAHPGLPLPGPTPNWWTVKYLCPLSVPNTRWSQKLPLRQRRRGVEASPEAPRSALRPPTCSLTPARPVRYTCPCAFSSSVGCGTLPCTNENAPTPKGERLFVRTPRPWRPIATIWTSAQGPSIRASWPDRWRSFGGASGGSANSVPGRSVIASCPSAWRTMSASLGSVGSGGRVRGS